MLALLAALTATSGCDTLIDRGIESNLTRSEEKLPDGPDMTVVLCGTGTPLADPDRAAACTAVLAGGNFVVVDAGPGSAEAADLANLPLGRLSAVLLTHFHSDHIGDLGQLATASWIAGRTRPLDIYGPEGTARVAGGFAAAYALDVGYRNVHHGEANMPAAAAALVPHEIPLGPAPDASAVVLDDGGLQVTMFRVDHDPITPAVGYRFDYAGRSVVVSGDTKKSASLIEHARGADILVHEALQPEMIERAAKVADRIGNRRLAQMARDTLNYHTSPVEVAEVARDAGVKTLVFTHMVPGPNNLIIRRQFLAGVADVFKGQVVLGKDGERFTLTPATAPAAPAAKEAP
jgi:ribonuclease Z